MVWMDFVDPDELMPVYDLLYDDEPRQRMVLPSLIQINSEKSFRVQNNNGQASKIQLPLLVHND